MADAEKIAKAIITPEVAEQLYKDAVQPAAKQMGKNLETVSKAVTCALYPLEGSIWCFDQIKEWLCKKVSEKLEGVDPNRIHQPKASIAGPLMINLHFCKDEETLRELYANLLASSMNDEMSNFVHPSYVHIIEQICSDEAKMLKFFADIMDSDGNIGEYYYYSKLEEKVELSNPDNIGAYFDNLLRLRVIERRQFTNVQYIPEGGDRYGSWAPSVEANEEESTHVTELGQGFMNACIVPYEE